ncbi:MAG TPA: nucleotidyltransferase domain-containing protein [Clostridiaceae bacterium]|nr:nucleotidyltransferase domain-containing protein [Clostridiaceae bacterium]
MLLLPNEREAIKRTWIERQRKNKIEMQKRMNEAFCCAKKVAYFLKENYGVDKVYLYGSLAKGEYFDKLSDIDLYITGWKNEKQYWSMLAEAQSLSRPYPISIVTEREALPSLKQIVEKEGILLV